MNLAITSKENKEIDNKLSVVVNNYNMFSSGKKNKPISQDFRQFELNIKIYFLFLYIKKKHRNL